MITRCTDSRKREEEWGEGTWTESCGELAEGSKFDERRRELGWGIVGVTNLRPEVSALQ